MIDIWLVYRPKEAEFFEMFKLFTTSKDAYAFAESVGFEDPFGMGNDDRVGFMNTYSAGDIDVRVMHLQTEVITTENIAYSMGREHA